MSLKTKIQNHTATVGIIGLGYVGLPIARAFGHEGFPVLGFDIDQEKVDTLNDGRSYLDHIPDADIMRMGEDGFRATTDYAEIPDADAVLICVPTPLSEHHEPDTRFIESTCQSIAQHLRPGQLIVLESTTYPGTTRELMRPLLEESGLRAGEDFYLGYSPEREDPGSRTHTMADIPKVTAGLSDTCGELTRLLYDQVVVETVPVSTTDTAEATKLLENIYRSVNIALVNELKTLFHEMDIDVFEVIDAARTKPFGFKAFYPGPGLGGHCIPIDPFYLSWKAREYDRPARFIELSGEVNTSMPNFVVDRVAGALNTHKKPINGSSILLLGVSYKKNVGDTRESPALRLMELLEGKGAHVEYSDPHVPRLPALRDYDFDKSSVELTPETLTACDCAVVVTAHEAFDVGMIRRNAPLIVDTRNMLEPTRDEADKIFKA